MTSVILEEVGGKMEALHDPGCDSGGGGRGNVEPPGCDSGGGGRR